MTVIILLVLNIIIDTLIGVVLLINVIYFSLLREPIKKIIQEETNEN